jgi:hypothetical protein
LVGWRSGFTPRWFWRNRGVKPLLQFACDAAGLAPRIFTAAVPRQVIRGRLAWGKPQRRGRGARGGSARILRNLRVLRVSTGFWAQIIGTSAANLSLPAANLGTPAANPKAPAAPPGLPAAYLTICAANLGTRAANQTGAAANLGALAANLGGVAAKLKIAPRNYFCEWQWMRILRHARCRNLRLCDALPRK